ncbi:MAG: 2-phosphosulfolactate phosphatase, partial [Alphaproteobacteria bacterium]|nr:2-phosphosulfolactate phosphatase [Alphaproteobacteria bacterium]
MDIRIESLEEGAAKASGAVAIIDVFRAFTTAAVVLANGAERIAMAGTVEEALNLRAKGEGQICMGEEQGRRPAGFDFGNSPQELSKADLRGKSIVQRTSHGTQGILAAAPRAAVLYAASFVTARATARALKASGEKVITLVAMGRGGRRSTEDEMCALYLRFLLQGREADSEAFRKIVLSGSEAAYFGHPSRPWMDANDPVIAMDIDRYDFAV